MLESANTLATLQSKPIALHSFVSSACYLLFGVVVIVFSRAKRYGRLRVAGAAADS